MREIAKAIGDSNTVSVVSELLHLRVLAGEKRGAANAVVRAANDNQLLGLHRLLQKQRWITHCYAEQFGAQTFAPPPPNWNPGHPLMNGRLGQLLAAHGPSVEPARRDYDG